MLEVIFSLGVPRKSINSWLIELLNSHLWSGITTRGSPKVMNGCGLHKVLMEIMCITPHFPSPSQPHPETNFTWKGEVTTPFVAFEARMNGGSTTFLDL